MVDYKCEGINSGKIVNFYVSHVRIGVLNLQYQHHLKTEHFIHKISSEVGENMYICEMHGSHISPIEFD